MDSVFFFFKKQPLSATTAMYWEKIKGISNENAKLNTQIGNTRGVGQCYLIYITRGPLLWEHTHTEQHIPMHTQKNRKQRNRDAGLIKAAHSPDFSFPADVGTFKCYQGSCSEHAANFHPHPPQPCTFLPHQQGGQVFCTKHPIPCC